MKTSIRARRARRFSPALRLVQCADVQWFSILNKKNWVSNEDSNEDEDRCAHNFLFTDELNNRLGQTHLIRFFAFFFQRTSLGNKEADFEVNQCIFRLIFSNISKKRRNRMSWIFKWSFKFYEPWEQRIPQWRRNTGRPHNWQLWENCSFRWPTDRTTRPDSRDSRKSDL